MDVGADLYADLLSIEYDRILALVLEQDEEKGIGAAQGSEWACQGWGGERGPLRVRDLGVGRSGFGAWKRAV